MSAIEEVTKHVQEDQQRTKIKAMADALLANMKECIMLAMTKNNGRIEALEKRITELESKQ
jgi:polyhydroxyalkanoate synthesis regulator phasin